MSGSHTVRSTGQPRADATIEALIAAFEAAFPGRIGSYYIEGSFADRSAVATSDLDFIIVFDAPFRSADDKALAVRTRDACAAASDLELDVMLMDVQQLQTADPMFKFGAQLVYGSDIRDRIPLIPIELWARERMHASFWNMIHTFNRPQPVAAVLDFPDASDAFFGYAARTMRLADGSEIVTTRNLIRITGWIATTRIAYEARQYVHRKRDCVPAYARFINDEWTGLLTTLHRRCRIDWQYRIPGSAAERDELRAICRQTLAFEDHFSACYRRFMLAELSSTEPAGRQFALEMLQRTSIDDPAIVEAADRVARET